MRTYIPGASPIHRCDARVKIILLIAFSIALFLVDTWAGLAVAAVLYAIAHAASRIPFSAVAKMGVPLFALVAFALLCSALSLNVSELPSASADAVRMAGPFASCGPIAIAGTFGINPIGFGQGLFSGVRVVILLFASLLVCLSTTSDDIRLAFSSFLSPLRATKLPVDDASSALSIALRFIPVCAEELSCVHDAQLSRGAALEGKGPLRALAAWATVFVPVFVRLFRRADKLALAMDARCFGALPPGKKTSLRETSFRACDAVVLAVGIGAFSLLAVLF